MSKTSLLRFRADVHVKCGSWMCTKRQLWRCSRLHLCGDRLERQGRCTACLVMPPAARDSLCSTPHVTTTSAPAAAACCITISTLHGALCTVRPSLRRQLSSSRLGMLWQWPLYHWIATDLQQHAADHGLPNTSAVALLVQPFHA